MFIYIGFRFWGVVCFLFCVVAGVLSCVFLSCSVSCEWPVAHAGLCAMWCSFRCGCWFCCRLHGAGLVLQSLLDGMVSCGSGGILIAACGISTSSSCSGPHRCAHIVNVFESACLALKERGLKQPPPYMS